MIALESLLFSLFEMRGGVGLLDSMLGFDWTNSSL